MQTFDTFYTYGFDNNKFYWCSVAFPIKNETKQGTHSWKSNNRRGEIVQKTPLMSLILKIISFYLIKGNHDSRFWMIQELVEFVSWSLQSRMPTWSCQRFSQLKKSYLRTVDAYTDVILLHELDMQIQHLDKIWFKNLGWLQCYDSFNIDVTVWNEELPNGGVILSTAACDIWLA